MGPTYIHSQAPCTISWSFETSKTLEIARLSIETCLWPMYEMENGEITQGRKIKDARQVEEYLRTQKRFRRLFTMNGGEEEILKNQAIADWNIKHFELQ